ncbi:MAG TPA: Rieske 2Fe-2S domain-containing protein [Candidatus Sulfotelmatobacter sp.]|nr:Rieske 2Fe-2S domain-containing protein [Candidatus Sulfotelmatobacter sp.]
MSTISQQLPEQDYSRIGYSFYHDPAIYKLEQERVFRGPTWSILGLEAEIPKAGDFRVVYVGETPVVLNRDNAGQVHAFVNRCAHRGAEIVREPYGNAADHTCIYHAWCYSHQGDLLGVPFQKGVNGKGGMPPGFDISRHGLTKLRVTCWKGAIFGTFSAATEPLESYLGPMMVENLGEILSRPIRILGYQRQRIHANWKLYAENTRDAYHASLLHEFNRTFGLSRLTQRSGGYLDDRGRHTLLFQHAGSDSDSDANQAYKDNRVQRGDYMTLEDRDLVTTVREWPSGVTTRIMSLFPGGTFHQVSNCLGMRRVQTVSPDEFEVVFTIFGYQDDDDTMTRHRIKQANMVGPAGLISMEDGEALELVQRASLAEQQACAVVEMGGVGPIVSLDTRVNEIPIRGMWSYYSELMGYAAGASR